MSTINDEVIHAILTSEHNASSIQVLDWHIDDITEKKSNNYMTQISRLVVRYRSQTEESTSPQQKIFFLKMPTAAPLYQLAVNMGAYNNEVAIYTEVLPHMYTFVDEYFTPRQYYFDDEMSLVLEDLSQSGFKCTAPNQKLDIEHCIYTLRGLAKFHALSVKVEKTVGLPEVVKRHPLYDPDNNEFCTGLITQQMPMFIDSVPQHLKDRYPSLITQFENTTIDTLINLHNDSSAYKFNVLNHGDFSINNIMFKYDKYGTVEKVKFIDFQFASWGSPAWDLTYFAITSMTFEDYLKYFPLLLKIYVKTLNNVLRQLDCPTCDTQSLLNDIDTLYPYNLHVLCCLLPYIVCDPNDRVNTEDMCKDEKLEVNCVAKTYKHKHYQKMLVKWFEHFAQRGTLRIDEEPLSTESSTG